MTRTPDHSAMRRTKAAMLARGAVMVLVLGAVLLMIPTAHVDALKAAGAFKGEAIGGVETFVEKLKGNVVWLGGTMTALVIAVVAIMFMVGHSRAHDIAIRTVVGLAILASISGIVA
jgi:hypothetical protein